MQVFFQPLQTCLIHFEIPCIFSQNHFPLPVLSCGGVWRVFAADSRALRRARSCIAITRKHVWRNVPMKMPKFEVNLHIPPWTKTSDGQIRNHQFIVHYTIHWSLAPSTNAFWGTSDSCIVYQDHMMICVIS